METGSTAEAVHLSAAARYRVDVDSDGGQRAPVQVAEQAAPGEPLDFCLDPPGGDAVLAQDDASQATVAGRLVGGQGGQEVLAAEVGVPEPDGVLVGLFRDGAGVRGQNGPEFTLEIRNGKESNSSPLLIYSTLGGLPQGPGNAA
jgi:hypothetical protein